MIKVLKAGLETSIQDYPGRIGYWNQGFPPSGPMDSWSFRMANVLVGNAPGAAGRGAIWRWIINSLLAIKSAFFAGWC